MTRRFLSVFVVMMMLGTGQAMAVEPSNHGHVGGYAGINGSYAFDLSDSPIDQNTDSSGAASMWVGYRMDPLISIEVQGEWNDGFSKIDGWNLIGNLNWYPLQYWKEGFWFQPFFVTGAGIAVAKPRPKSSTALNGAFRLGLGMDFYVSEHWSIRTKGEWVPAVGKLSDLKYIPVSLGFQYHW